MVTPALLLLADGRLPAGGHVHSGGIEAAIDAGVVTDAGDLADWCRGRLLGIGRVEAGLTAAAWHEATRPPGERLGWEVLVRETEARTPVAALREVARVRGRGLLRVARATWGDLLDPLDLPGAADRPGLPLPVVLGAVAAVTGCTCEEAALLAATGAVTEPAQAALRLLGLDPLAVTRLVATLDPDLRAVAVEAARAGAGRPVDWAVTSTPTFDLLAATHAARDERLFAS